MSVTDGTRWRSRNAQCDDPDHGTPIALTHELNVACPGYYAFHAHCRRCHHDDHNACEMCGRCVAEPRHWRQGGRFRDRYYCSNACRQKAYRQRATA